MKNGTVSKDRDSRRPWQRWTALLIVAGLGAVLLSGCKLSGDGLVVEIEEERIQQQLNSRFPVRKNYLVANVSVTDPKVQLRGSDERIHVGVNVEVSVPTQPVQKGSATLSGKINYASETGEFFLSDANVESIETAAITGPAKDQVKEVLGIVTREALNRVPIYKLEKSDRIQSLAQLFLKKVTVGDKKLEITMGMK